MPAFLFTLLPVIVFLVVVISILCVIAHYIRKGKRAMRNLFGTDSLAELIETRELDEANTPKSVAGMTSVYSPLLQHDFPELNWMELRSTAEQHLRDYLTDHGFTKIKIHRTEIRSYVRKSSTCTVIFQSSVEYYNETRKIQSRYNIHMLYVQDVTNLDLDNVKGISLNCPNCGGVLSLGRKQCEFCGVEVIPINMNVWELDKIVEEA